MTDRTVAELVADMTLAEKVGQMTQVSNESITPTEITEFFIGSVLSGGNGNPTPNEPTVWVDMVESFKDAAQQTRLGIPLIYGIDAVHGHSNVSGATIFPHNIGLGATGDENLVRNIGRATALEMLATGTDWAFAPTVTVPMDVRWGRTYEGYGNDPDLVGRMGAALIEGLQGNGESPGVLACAKHFVGDGATTWGTAPRIPWTDWWDGWGDAWQIDQGDARISEDELRSTHLAPYRAAIAVGVGSVMASYNSWNGDKLHGHRYLLTEVLKSELGFDGFVVSDWMGIDQIAPSYDDCVVAAINAGVDMVMVPDEYRQFIDSLTRAVESGRIGMDRIDDAVGRILTTKWDMGLAIDNTEPPPLEVVGSAAHRQLAAEAVRKSAVLLKNNGALPVAAKVSILVGGTAADDIGLQCGGWTVGWQGGFGRTTEGVTLLDGLRANPGWTVSYDSDGIAEDETMADVGIVCIAEPPYAEGPGDRAELLPTDDDLAVFEQVRQRTKTVILVVYSGRPIDTPNLVDRSDAVIAAWLPGSEAGALAELIDGQYPFTGRLTQPWPTNHETLNVGYGLTTPQGAPL